MSHFSRTIIDRAFQLLSPCWDALSSTINEGGRVVEDLNTSDEYPCLKSLRDLWVCFFFNYHAVFCLPARSFVCATAPHLHPWVLSHQGSAALTLCFTPSLLKVLRESEQNHWDNITVTTEDRNVPPFSTSTALLRPAFSLPVFQCLHCCLLKGAFAPEFITWVCIRVCH